MKPKKINENNPFVSNEIGQFYVYSTANLKI